MSHSPEGAVPGPQIGPLADVLAGLVRHHGDAPPAGWTIVKRNPARAVFRVDPGASGFDRPLYAKACPVRSGLSRLRQWLQGSPARMEADILESLRLRDLPAPPVLGWGVVRDDRGCLLGSWLITEEVPGQKVADVLRGELRGMLRGAERRRRGELLRRLGEFCRVLHDAGVVHRDLHTGNLLVAWSPAGEARLFVLDLQKSRIGAAPGRRTRVAELGKLLHGLLWDLRRTDLLRIVAAYSADAPRRSRLLLLRDAIAAARRVDRARLASRARHALKTSSGFVSERRGRFQVWRRREADPQAIEAAIAAHDAAEPERVEGLKVLAMSGWWPLLGRVRAALRLSRARHCWLAAVRLRARGLGAPAVVALVEERGGLPWLGLRRSLVVVAAESNLEPIMSLLSANAAAVTLSREQLAGVVGRFLARAHGAGVEIDARSLALGVRRLSSPMPAGPGGEGPDPAGVEVVPLDLERVRFHAGALGAGDRMASLAQIEAAGRGIEGVGVRMRLRVLVVYLRRCPGMAGSRADVRRLVAQVSSQADAHAGRQA